MHSPTSDQSSSKIPPSLAGALPDPTDPSLTQLFLATLASNYPNISFPVPAENNLGAFLLVARLLKLSRSHRTSLAKSLSMSEGATHLFQLDTKINSPNIKKKKYYPTQRFWARLLRAEAELVYPSLPESWHLPVSMLDIDRLYQAGSASGLSIDDFIREALQSPYLSEELKNFIGTSSADNKEMTKLGLTPAEYYDQPDSTLVLSEDANNNTSTNTSSNPQYSAIIAAQQKTGFSYFPKALLPWLRHIEDLVKQDVSGVLTFTGHNSDSENSPHSITVDIRSCPLGIQWGYHPNALHQVGVVLSSWLMSPHNPGAGATLRIATDRKDPLINWPIQEIRGWYLDSQTSPPAQGLIAEDMMAAHETDHATGERTRDPEYGVIYKDSDDF